MEKEMSENGENGTLSTVEQQAKVWETLKSRNCQAAGDVSDAGACPERQWPTYDQVISHMANADYNQTLTCPFDVLSQDVVKTFAPYGVVCCAKVELFDFPGANHEGNPYTGLLTPGNTLEHCVLRLSSAMKPPNLEVKSTLGRALLYTAGEKIRNARLYPAAALKVFRDNGAESGNLLFGGSKLGQREHNFFAHCLCTSMTERMPRAIKPFVRKFWTYSDYPLSLGVSDFCKVNSKGAPIEDPKAVNFPFAVILRPTAALSTDDAASNEEVDSFDSFVDHILKVPSDTTLYDLFACPDPYAVTEVAKLERIGRIMTTSEMISSAPNDGVFFKHQKKEEDYALRPDWPTALNAQVSVDEGRFKGTVGKMAGWKVFEQHIDKGGFVDFERDEDL